MKAHDWREGLLQEACGGMLFMDACHASVPGTCSPLLPLLLLLTVPLPGSLDDASSTWGLVTVSTGNAVQGRALVCQTMRIAGNTAGGRRVQVVTDGDPGFIGSLMLGVVAVVIHSHALASIMVTSKGASREALGGLTARVTPYGLKPRSGSGGLMALVSGIGAAWGVKPDIAGYTGLVNAR